ncbi:hypothetical protein VOLCADRAFT_121298 [Volvox carteri f. nagariensis]|uniref:S-adenosylmethionine-dependent methyltransferase domain-containing protein n=1 Tax=Volvox carteri f. nagariensis TaxID=3068 RepID=D8U6U2_VOLCA|nr:uncharacterized protein VOLCADRAFT_121298 [Volvox carteri f. nagariensis]EFJ44499.1 hypothetical protein VOLCADRAFT_121298 [Volvox carteri f. nagariensis]|eukprot:XP_002954349.1 hypothetical protein VOLCADRAFT_121298 [Volvox carteri f. nagariensis]
MGLINLLNEKPVHLVLAKDRVRSIKRGHPWIFPEVLRELPKAPPGSLALLKTAEGDVLAKGYYDPGSKLAFRSFALQRDKLDEQLIAARLERAAQLRDMLFEPYDTTNGFRLVNGEGDGLPGLVVDMYDSAAVMKLDGAGAESFYNSREIASWLMFRFSSRLKTVFLKYRAGASSSSDGALGSGSGSGSGSNRGSGVSASSETPGAGVDEGRGRLLAGEPPVAGRPVRFLENGVTFQADIVQGQKTGFFLDQRDNRAFVGRLAGGKRVLNVFGYTGGFSVYAGVGGARHVTTVDLGRAALSYATANWALNGLVPERHVAAAEDAFEFLEAAIKGREKWDVVIIDPPSFAPNKQSVEKARASYTRLFAAAAAVTAAHGSLSLASCSSHIDSPMFMEVCSEALGKARRQGYVVRVAGQPADHPFPAAADELSYLKFVTFRLEG